MSQDLSKRAQAQFSTAARSMVNPSSVVTSGTIPLKTVLEVAYSTKVGGEFQAQGLTDLAGSILHIEEKLNLIMQKLGIPVTRP